MIHVIDDVLREIQSEIASHAPERGGALLGPRGRLLVTRFVADPDAETTFASYRTSRRLRERVRDLETSGDLEFKGIVHSHPAGIDHPSGPDRRTISDSLEQNPHLSVFLCPIVTHREARAEHELALGTAKLSMFAVSRRRRGPSAPEPVVFSVIPIRRDLEAAAALLGATGTRDVGMVELDGQSLIAHALDLPGGGDALLLFSELHPTTPPVVLVTLTGAATRQLDLHWQLSTPAADRLTLALKAHFDAPGPYGHAYGPTSVGAVTTNPAVGALAGWPSIMTGSDAAARARDLRTASLARTQAILGDALRGQHVLVVGAGSVGSYCVEQLARSGVESFTLVDPDHVESANLSRTVYDLGDLGELKVNALARRVARISPSVEVEPLGESLGQLGSELLNTAVSRAALVLATTDDPKAQRQLDRAARAAGRSVVHVGLYAGAKGGEIILSDPELTCCYECATITRHRNEATLGRVAGETDYGTGRLKGEVALGVDIQHVSSAAVKLALSLLAGSAEGVELAGFARGAIGNGFTYLTMSMTPDYWFYPRIFGEAAGQHAYQSVWLSPARRDDCSCCGAPEYREIGDGPAAPTPALAALRRASSSAAAAGPKGVAAKKGARVKAKKQHAGGRR